MHATLQRLRAAAAAATAVLAALAAPAQAQLIYEPWPKLPWPVLAPPAPDEFVEITAGANHTCARQYGGNVYCWGRNNVGQAGRPSKRLCSGIACNDRPTLVIANARQIDAGTEHTCALLTDGKTWCWGSASRGQLGSGVFGDSTDSGPQAVQGPAFTAISAGGLSGCGINAQGAFCWGIMGGGQPQPVQVAAYGSYTGVQVGMHHGCLSVNLGSWSELDCWGFNHQGQVGIDPAIDLNVPAAARAGFGTDVGTASLQNDVTCVEQRKGTVECIGANNSGQLGGGRTGGAPNFKPVEVGGGKALRGVSVGENHACALDTAGAAWCWGRGNFGQVGVNTFNATVLDFPSPVQVPGGRTYRAIAAGGLHTCAIGTDNKIYCWGSNYNGQLGTQYPGGWVWVPVQALDPL